MTDYQETKMVFAKIDAEHAKRVQNKKEEYEWKEWYESKFAPKLTPSQDQLLTQIREVDKKLKINGYYRQARLVDIKKVRHNVPLPHLTQQPFQILRGKI